MKLHVDPLEGINAIQAVYTDGVTVSGQRWRGSLVLPWSGAIRPWACQAFSQLHATDLASLLEPGPELILLGTGPRQHFPHPTLIQPLVQGRIGLESMSTDAACRTYNILAAEGRKVLAALIFET
jgi:uncharacterized protein